MRSALGAALLAAALLGGCAGGGNVYGRQEARSVWEVRPGRVVDVQPATIEGRRSEVGRIGGGLVGYELARTVGQGAGSRVAGAVGGVAGAVAGEALEERATRQAAYEITVELDEGRTIVVVQPADVRFAAGDAVRVYTRGGQARVARR